MNVKNRLMEIEGINNVVCRGNGDLEIYSNNNTEIRNKVLTFLSLNCLEFCFNKVNLIEIPEQ